MDGYFRKSGNYCFTSGSNCLLSVLSMTTNEQRKATDMTMHMRNSIYSSSARFDTAQPMTDDEMRKIAPSIFAVTAHESRSERFKPIPTIDVLNGLRDNGFFPVAVKQGGSRVEGKAEFTKHMIRMRRFDNVEKYKVGDNVCEIILKNANDGTSAYELMAGMFRIRCMNSLVAQTSTIDSVKIRHSGHAVDNVIEGTFRVLGEAENLLAAPQDWGRIEMSRDAKMAFAEAAHVLRFDEEETPFQPIQLLQPRRHDDQANDLWSQFNIVQENAIRGGLHAITRDANNRKRRVTTREIKGIDQDIKLNKALWTLSEKMAAILKTAA
jgi:hypothetical protein